MNGGFFVLSPEVGALPRRRRHGVGAGAAARPGARRQLASFATMASGIRWTRCGTATSSRACGTPGAAPWRTLVSDRGQSTRVLARPARARHRPHRLQGRLAVAVAAGAGRRVSRALRTCPPTPRCMSWRGCATGWREEVIADVRDPAAVADAIHGAGARDRHPHGGAAARAPLVRRSARDVRHQRHGHRQRAGGGARDAGSARRWWSSPRTSATRTAVGSGGTARTSRWAATTPTRAPRERRSSSSPPTAGRSSPDPAGPRVASARAGNVIGGGDWAPERLDSRPRPGALDGRRCCDPQSRRGASLAARAQPAERLPAARPSAVGLARRSPAAGTSGPPTDDAQPVSWIVERHARTLVGQARWEADPGPHPHEAAYLKLDSSRLGCGWAGAWCPSKQRSTASWTGTRRSRRRRHARDHLRSVPRPRPSPSCATRSGEG